MLQFYKYDLLGSYGRKDENMKNDSPLFCEWQKYVDDLDGTEIVIDDKVTKLETFAFQNCPNVKKITIGKNVKTIEDGAFSRCYPLEEVYIHPDNKYFFVEENNIIEKKTNRLVLCVGTPKISDSVREADFSSVFRAAHDIDTLYLGKSLQKLDRAARRFHFDHIELHPDNPYLEVRNDCLYEKGGTELILAGGCGVIDGRTTKIKRAAFEYADIERIVIPASVVEIEREAFHFCNVREFVFEEGLEKIGFRAFDTCERLKELTLPASLKEVGEGAFGYCESLESIHSFGGADKIADSQFIFCKSLKKVIIPGNIKRIDRCAFYGCTALQEAVLEDGVKSLDESVFDGCEALEKVTMADSVTKIGYESFYDCKELKEIRLSENLREIPMRAFCGCKKLKEIYLPASVVKLCEVAFSDCEALENINVDNVLKSYRDTFEGCKKLPKEIKAPKKPPAKKKGLAENMYSYYDFDEIRSNFGPDDTIYLLTDTRREIEVLITDIFVFEDDEYICVMYKDEMYFVEIDSEPDEEMDDVYPAAVFGKGHKYYDTLLQVYADETEACEGEEED